MLKLQFLDQPEKSFWLVDSSITIGADAVNDIVSSAPGVAGRHARLAIDGDRVTLFPVDGELLVNGLPVTDGQLLAVGDELSAGSLALRVIDPKTAVASKVTGSSDAVAGGWRLLAQHPKLSGQPMPLAESTVLGRSRDCDITIPYRMLSRQHVRLERVGDTLMVTDLGSSNGTYLNGKRIQQGTAMPGDTLTLARLNFVIAGPETRSPDSDPARTQLRPALSAAALAEAQQQVRIEPADVSDSMEDELIEKPPVTNPSAADQPPSPAIPHWLVVTVLLLLGAITVSLLLG